MERAALINSKRDHESDDVVGGCCNHDTYKANGIGRIKPSPCSSDDQPPSWQTRLVFACMCFTSFLSGVYFAMIAPFFPIMAKEKGIGTVGIGVVLSCFQLVMLLTTPVFGKIVVHTGPRFFYSSGILVCGVCSALFGVLEFCPRGAVFLTMSIITRSLEGAAVSAFVTSGFTATASMFPQNAGKAVGMLEAMESLGFILGPVIGSAIYQVSGYMWTFVYMAVPLIVTGSTAACFMRVDEGHISGNSPMLPFLGNPKVLLLGLLPFILNGIGFTSVFTTLALRLQQFQLSSLTRGAMFLPLPVCYSLFSPIIGHLVDKHPRFAFPVMCTGSFIFLLGFFIIGPAPFIPFLPRNTLWLFAIGLGMIGFAGSAVPAVYGQLLSVARERGYPEDVATHGMVSATFLGLATGGSFLGPIISGSLFDAVGFEWDSTIIGFLGLVLLIIFAIYNGFTKCRGNHNTQETGSDVESNKA